MHLPNTSRAERPLKRAFTLSTPPSPPTTGFSREDLPDGGEVDGQLGARGRRLHKQTTQNEAEGLQSSHASTAGRARF